MATGLHLKASVVSAITEVIATHPIDYTKTVLQKNNVVNFRDIIKTPYKGLSPRLVGIVPMRMVFWNSIDYFHNRGFNSCMAKVLTSIIQTTIDFPIEQAKTQKMIYNKSFLKSFNDIKLIPSISTHLLRNMFLLYQLIP